MIDNTKKQHFDLPLITLIAFFCSRFLTKVFTMILGTKGVLITMAVLAVLFVLSIFVNIRKKQFSFLMFFVLFFGLLALTALTYYLNPKIGYWLTDPSFGFAIKVFNVRTSISALLVILLVRDFDRITRGLEIAAWINFIYLMIQVGLYYTAGHWENFFVSFEPLRESKYNMSLGYDLIFVSFVLLTRHIKNRKDLLSLVAGVFAMAFAIIFGSRGVLILAVAYFLCYVIFFWKSFIKGKLYQTFLVVILSVSLAVIVIPLVQQTIDHMLTPPTTTTGEEPPPAQEEESRTISMIKGGEFFESNGRQKIWKAGIKAFLEKPILGQGVFGDRPFVGVTHRWGYSHNVLIELASNFGIPGILFGLGTVALLVAALIFREDRIKHLLIIFTAMLVKLLISDSFYFYEMFWASVGLLYLIYFDRKDKYKLKTALSLAFLACTVLFSALSFYRAYKNQTVNSLRIEKPTAVIAITDYSSNEFPAMKSLLDSSGLKFSIFKDPQNADAYGLAKLGYDIQDHMVVSKPYVVSGPKAIDKDLQRSKNNAKYSGGSEPTAIIAPKYSYATPVHYYLKDKRLFLIDNAKEIVTYKQINDNNRLTLEANIFFSGNKFGEPTTLEAEKQAVDQLLDKVKNEKDLAILDFKVSDTDNYALLEYALSGIKQRGIQTENFTDLSKQMLEFKPGESMKQNFLDNLGIKRIFSGGAQ